MFQESLIKNELQELAYANELLLKSFRGNSFLISGAGGLIGAYLILLLVEANELFDLGVRIAAIDRNVDLLKRYIKYNDCVSCYNVDVCSGGLPQEKFDYVIHAASNTSPVDYAQKPIDTIWTNICGAKNLMDLSVRFKAERFLFCSSVEAYGKNNGDIDKFTESYSGYVDCNTVRAGYPTSKRCVEALCNAYASEYADFDFVIARIGRFYGPTVIEGDTKAPSQFIDNAVRGEDIVLKSDGTQLYSWGYVADCATAMLTLLKKGAKGEVYNVADPESCSMLKEFAQYVASAAGVKLSFIQLSDVEKEAYSKITKATMDTSKLEALGWKAKYHLENGITRTINYMQRNKDF